MNTPILFIDGVTPLSAELRGLLVQLAQCQFVRAYDLDDGCMEGVRAVMICSHVDQRALQSRQTLLQKHFDSGVNMVVNGHVAHPFLDVLQPFVPLPRQSREELQVHRLAEHPVFEGVDAHDLTYRRGVAGFYGRGYNPPPPGARMINGLGTRRLPLDWEYDTAGSGKLLMHAGNDLWMHATDETSARRILPQLIHWLLEEVPA